MLLLYSSSDCCNQHTVIKINYATGAGTMAYVYQPQDPILVYPRPHFVPHQCLCWMVIPICTCELRFQCWLILIPMRDPPYPFIDLCS